MQRPQRWRPSRRQPPPRTGVLRARLPQGPQGVTRLGTVLAHFLNPAATRPTLGRVEERTLLGRAQSALASNRYIALRSTKGLGGAQGRLGPWRPRSPHVHYVPRRQFCPRETVLGEQSTRGARSSPSFWSGGWIAAHCGRRGQAVVRERTPEGLDDWLVPRVINSFTAPVLPMIYRKRPPKISGVLTHRTLIRNILGRPANWFE